MEVSYYSFRDREKIDVRWLAASRNKIMDILSYCMMRKDIAFSLYIYAFCGEEDV